MFSHLCRVTHMISLGVVMDPIESINYKKTRRWHCCGQRKTEAGHCSTSSRTGCLSRGGTDGSIMPLRVYRDPSRWFDIDEAVSAPVSDFDIVLAQRSSSTWNMSIDLPTRASRYRHLGRELLPKLA